MVDGNEEEWWRCWEVNVRGVYWVTKALLPLLLKEGGEKTVINVTSTGALALTKGASAYQPSKLAVMRLAEYFMADYVDQVSVFLFPFYSDGLSHWLFSGRVVLRVT